MKHHRLALAVVTVCLVLIPNEHAFAGYETNYANVDVSKWRCLLCEFETYYGKSGQFSMATVHTTDDSDRFGRDGSFERAGTRSILDARMAVSGANGWVVNGSTTNIGLDSNDMSIVIKNRSSIDSQIRFQQYRRLSESEALSPFRRTNDRLTLGSDWHRNSQTHGFSSLETANRLIELATTRRLLESNVSVQLIPRIKLLLAHRSTSKEGTEETFRDGLLQSTSLPKALDQESVTNSIQFRYRDERLNATWSRSRSTFRNSEPLLKWESPYLLGVLENESTNPFSYKHSSETFDVGLSLPLNGMLRFHERRGVNETHPQSLKYGLSDQISDVDPVLLFAKRDYQSRRLVITTEFLRDLELSASRLFYELKDHRPTEILTPALGGLFLLPPHALRFGDFHRRESEIGVHYRPDSGMRVGTRAWGKTLTRTDQEIVENRTKGLEVTVAKPLYGRWETFTTILRESRDSSEFQDITTNNPYTRRFHQAPMKRRVWSGGMTYSWLEKSDFISLATDLERRTYPDSVLGLSLTESRGLTATYGFRIGERVAADGYVASHRQSSEIYGSQSLDLLMPWTYSSDDGVISAGLKVLFEPVNGFIDNIQVDYTLSDGHAKLETVFEESTSFFPSQVSRHESVDISMVFREIYGLWIEARMYIEKYEPNDWSIDNVNQSTLPSVLTMGRNNPSYENTLFSIRFKRSI